ncbi:MAG: hypothetical protein KJ880_03155 [Candidatus Omnitrophica bacterium]|nr:hypothetical protein [Candidatus Omnitrophota bacterium]MBU1868958.1 hypothetical protein [Candidatus Omnitrophota bacterium]
MAKLYGIHILTQEKTVFKGEISSLVVPAELGFLGVLADHAPLVAMLKPGKITLKSGAQSPVEIQSAGAGFLEVRKNNVTILLDSVA